MGFICSFIKNIDKIIQYLGYSKTGLCYYYISKFMKTALKSKEDFKSIEFDFKGL